MKISSKLPGRSGVSSGHFLPATVLSGGAVFILLLTLQRTRNLPRGVSFCEQHIPEKNHHLLLWFGAFTAVSTSFMLLVETYYQIVTASYHPMTHQILYLCYMAVGFATMLEAKGRLPPDSHRRSLSLNLFLQFLIFLDHGLDKPTPTDSKMHVMLALADLAGCLLLAFSVWHPSSMEAYVAGWASLLLQGTWFATLGLYSGFIDIPVERVCTYLGAEVIFIATIIGAVVAVFYQEEPVKQNREREQEKVALTKELFP